MNKLTFLAGGRTFEAQEYPKGSPERTRLNESAITSEYMPSYKYYYITTMSAGATKTLKEAQNRASYMNNNNNNF